MSLTERDRAARRRLREDFAGYAERCLKIRTKTGTIAPLVLNRAQRHLHERLEAQRERTGGRVRALVLKARQQGFSTYIGARFYWKTTHRRGCQAFILTHEQDATANLFGMVKRFQEHCPPALRPSIGRGNSRELWFDRLDSGYTVGAAGADAVGRSKTIQLFHGSEAAFWKNAREHFAGVMQAIPDLADTEIIIESTGNGPSGELYERWQRAEAGIGDYEAIFTPWFWSDDYRRPVPEDFALEPEDAAYAAAHGLDLEQMAWRRAKLAELKDPMLFMQEYPATAHEAFQASGHDGFIKPDAVLRARKASVDGIGPLIVGVDPKREGEDRFAIAWRQGRKLLKVESDPSPVDALTAASRVKRVIDEDRPARVFMDVGGPGGAIGDILRSWGEPYAGLVRLVNFGSSPLEPVRLMADGTRRPGPRNRRAEMWMRSRDWLDEEGGVDIPDRDSLQSDACAPGYFYDLQQRLLLEAKERMAARGVRSPDEWDAVALTFAEPVAEPRPGPARLAAAQGGARWMG